MPKPTAAKTANFSKPVDVMFGRFVRDKACIPYATTTLSFWDAARDLTLVGEMPGREQEWTIEQLFQRDVDFARVEKEIVPYLKSTTSAQFFNSLLIALLPYSSSNKEVVSFSEGEWDPPGIDSMRGMK